VAVRLLETMSETPEGRNVHTCIYNCTTTLFLTYSRKQEVVVVVVVVVVVLLWLHTCVNNSPKYMYLKTLGEPKYEANIHAFR
jgi:hypothetical protein